MVHKIDSLATTHGRNGPNSATLEAYILRGRIVLVFSSDGLNDTAHAENCHCRVDEFINVLAYALHSI